MLLLETMSRMIEILDHRGSQGFQKLVCPDAQPSTLQLRVSELLGLCPLDTVWLGLNSLWRSAEPWHFDQGQQAAANEPHPMSLFAPVGKLVDNLTKNLVLSVQEANEVGIRHSGG